MNTYKAFYKGKTLIVQAETTYAAQTLAAKQFKAKKQYEVDVYLVEKDGQPYIHTAT